MSCAIDTNVLVDLVGAEQRYADRVADALEQESAKGALWIASPVYAECLAHPRWDEKGLDQFLVDARVSVDWELGRAVWQRAGSAYGSYARRRARAVGGQPRRHLVDFVIGAHAESIGGLVTRDMGHYRTYFPQLRLVVP